MFVVSRIALLLTLWVSLLASVGRAQAPTSTPSPDPPAAGAIPLAEINTQADKPETLLRDNAAKAAALDAEEETAERAMEWRQSIQQSLETVAAQPSLHALRGLERVWRERAQAAAERQGLTARLTATDAELKQLKQERLRWENTLNQIDNPVLLEVVFDRSLTTSFLV